MDYVARIIRKDGSMVEQPCADMDAGQRWVEKNRKDGDKGNAVVKK